jgi:cell wall-associated NlpC family hydrolase
MAETIHAVKPGESLSSIAKKYHISVEQIQDANEIGDEKLQIGQKLIIPSQPPVAGKSSKRKKADKPEDLEEESREWEIAETHVVKKGETLSKIARRYNLRVDELRAINHLPGNKLKAGQILYLQKREEDQERLDGEAKGEFSAKREDGAERAGVPVRGNGFLAEEKDYQLLVNVAKSFLGLRYNRGGTSINGMDCSGFVQKVFRVFDVDLPRTAREQFQVGFQVARNGLRVGDLVFFKRSQARYPSHVGIYIGGDQFIHTSLRKRQVEINSLESRYFHLRFIGAKRIVEARKELETAESISN